MRRKLLSLALALVLCLGLTIPALAAEVSNGKCTYELSNDPIETIKYGFEEHDWENGGSTIVERTVYIVPDNTTVTSKTVPNGRLSYEVYDFGDKDWFNSEKVINAGEPFAIIAIDEDSQSPLVCRVFSEDLNSEWGYNEEQPIALDYGEGGLCVMAQSAAVAAGLITQAPSTPTTPTTPSTGFTDVKASDYFAAPVAWAVEKGITNGTGNNQFSPNQNCTNAQILTFLWRAYGQPEPAISNPFTNNISEAYTKAAVWAYEKGMVSGSTFDVDGLCTRAMAVTYMWQAAGGPAPAAAAAFTDVQTDAAFAPAVSWAVEKGITTGTSGTTFSPNDICTRGQIAAFLHRGLA